VGWEGWAARARISGVVDRLAIFLVGLLAWTFAEYVIHAWLSHSFNTFAKPLHDVHHRDPHAVFAIRAWIPIVLTWLSGFALFGWTPGMVFYTGMATGFTLYEIIHYRVHFALPSGRLETALRMRHLVHHFRGSAACFGVTSALWDLIFGTEMTGVEMKRSIEAISTTPPLVGKSNLRRLLDFGIPARR
jgi:sterol desaturase/sphingolipid hydroxylase (fatty acid hydroxylase superfamily)